MKRSITWSKEKSELMIEIRRRYRDSPDYDDMDTQEERDMAYKEYRDGQDRLCFITTREDTEANLNYVMRRVKENFEREIYEMYKTGVMSKGRIDISILTSNNVEFKNCFYKTLNQMKQEDLATIE